MRYFYEKPLIYIPVFGESYLCNHPIYDRCTLFRIGNQGLAVIQQRFEPESKKSWWGEIDPWLNNEIYLNPKFKTYFEKRSGECDSEGLFPTVSVRQIMWALKMKPLPKARWETVFDRRDI